MLWQAVEKGDSCPRHCDRERSVAGSNPGFLPLFASAFLPRLRIATEILSGFPRRSAPRKGSLSVFQQPAKAIPAKGGTGFASGLALTILVTAAMYQIKMPRMIIKGCAFAVKLRFLYCMSASGWLWR